MFSLIKWTAVDFAKIIEAMLCIIRMIQAKPITDSIYTEKLLYQPNPNPNPLPIPAGSKNT